MSVRHSISHWIAAWRAGDQRAAEELWRRFYQRAASVARQRVRRLPHGDEEDVAAQALHSLLQRTAQGDFEQIGSRQDFWRLLMTITRRKAIDQYRRAARHKRGGADQTAPVRRLAASVLDKRTSRSPLAVLSFNETLQQLLSGVDEQMRTIVRCKLAGYTNVEIAARVGCSLPTVERRLRLLRAMWVQEALQCPTE